MNKKVQTDCLRACSKFISPAIPSAVEGSHYVPEKYQGDVSTTLRLLNMTEEAIFKQARGVCLKFISLPPRAQSRDLTTCLKSTREMFRLRFACST